MVDIRDQTNKELAMRLVTDIQSGDVFYSDLNGFQVGPALSQLCAPGEIKKRSDEGQSRRERNKVNVKLQLRMDDYAVLQ